jgi:hypothetical protein
MGYSDLSILIQGAICKKTESVIKNFRKIFPDSEIVVSTWIDHNGLDQFVDRWICNADPGGFNISVVGGKSYIDNINRQVVSTAAGLKMCNKPVVLKWRTDFLFNNEKVKKWLDLELKKYRCNNSYDRISVSSYWTINPFCKLGNIFHISDWFYLGRKETLFSSIRFSVVEKTISNTQISIKEFEKRRFPFGRFTAEQWMLMPLIDKIRQRQQLEYNSSEFRFNTLKLLGDKFNVVSPKTIGLISGKYDKVIYPQPANLREYISVWLTCVSEFDSRNLASKIRKPFGICILVAKGWLHQIGFSIRQSLKSK